MKQYINLHAHGFGSLLDGAAKAEEYAQRAIDLGQPAFTFTDHGNLFSLIENYKVSQKLGIPYFPGCLTSGQPIVTIDGVRDIENIKVGDLVLTHKGRYRKVNRIFKRNYTGTFYKVFLSDSNRSVTLTEEHPVLSYRDRDGVDWIEARHLKAGRKNRHGGVHSWNSYACFPKLQTTDSTVKLIDFMPSRYVVSEDHVSVTWDRGNGLSSTKKWFNFPSQFKIDSEFAWALGLFCAEGSTKENGGFNITLHKDEIGYANRFIDFCKAHQINAKYSVRKDKNSLEVTGCNPVLSFLFSGLVGRGAKNKRIPLLIKHADVEIRRAFVEGLLDGDGKQLSETNTFGTQSLKTASQPLAWDLRVVLASMGHWASVTQSTEEVKLPQGGEPKTFDFYMVYVKFDPKYKRCLESEGYVHKPFSKIESWEGTEMVYNFEVDEDNSYVSEFVVHNCEAYMARKTRFDCDPEELSGKATAEWQQRGPYHLTVLAVNNVGYHNLLKLSSRSYTEGFLRKPRIDKELISDHSDGLIVLSGCLSGEIQQALLRDDYNFALDSAAQMQDIVGRDNYFIEIMNHGIDEELRVHDDLQRIAKHIGAPIVATNDSHYTHRHNAASHDALLCINTGSIRSNPDRFKFANDSFYLKDYDEMSELFPEEWLDNTMKVYERIDFQPDLNTHHYPVFQIPESSPFKVIPNYFINEISKGAEDRFGPDWRTERRDVADRLNHEVGVIQEMGYDSYFLIVADIIRWCRENNILTGPGRGSAAGSLVSYCLRITHVDPLKFDLLFERFLTTGRVPDIDIDVDDRHRDKVLDYIRNKYGEDKTAQIITIAKIKAKTAINGITKVSGKPFDFGQVIVNAMPPAQYGVTKTLTECLEAEEFKHLYDTNEEIKEIIDLALEIEGTWRSDGIHAGGIIIADKAITEYCPVQQKGEGEPIVTQWDMRVVEEVGLLKIDLLGLSNLGIIEDTISRVKKNHGIDIGDPYELVEKSDPAVFKFLSEGNTAQVFQMGSDGLTTLARNMGIGSIKDIMAALALYRPGPMGSGFHHSYAKRKQGRQKATPLHPLLQKVLLSTYGILLYQEQVMATATQIAGFDPIAANKFLKSIGKKDREAMAATEESFVNGCVTHGGISTTEANDLFAAIEPHADYSFSAAHAVVYAYISYITAYLRYYYPAEYGAACLTSVMLSDEKSFRPVLNDIKEKFNIEVFPPSVNHSRYDFNVVDNNIVYSIAGLKGIGEKKSSKFVEHRDLSQHKYSDIYDFLRNSNVAVLDKTFIEALTFSGALDELVPDGAVLNTHVDVESHLTILLKELDTIGLSVTENPFDIYYSNIEFNEEVRPVSQISVFDGGQVNYSGIIRDPEIKISRAGKRFAKFRVDDGNDIFQCLILGRNVKEIESANGVQLEDLLLKGSFVVFRGKLNEREEEESSIYINEITLTYTPELLGDQINSLSLLVNNSDDYEKINVILSSNSGHKKVYLYFKHPDAQLVIRQKSLYTVSNNCEKDLQAFLIKR